MSDFCKLFKDDLIGQILVVNDDNEDGKPEVKFSLTPKGLGICSFSLKFTATDKGYEECDKAFEELTYDTVVAAARQFLTDMRLSAIGDDNE